MRSQNPRELARQVSELKESGMLKYTSAQRRHASEAIEPVPYFIIPSQAARGIGTMVMSFVNVNKHGFLSLTADKAFGVREKPTEPTIQYNATRLMEAHVIAEDLALRRGLYTPFGRAAAELYVAKMVAEDGNAPTYVPDRIAHMGTLLMEIQKEGVFQRIPQITGELERGIETLETYSEELAKK